MMKLLTRQGVLLEERGETYLADDDAGDDWTSRARSFGRVARAQASVPAALERLAAQPSPAAENRSGPCTLNRPEPKTSADRGVIRAFSPPPWAQTLATAPALTADTKGEGIVS